MLREIMVDMMMKYLLSGLNWNLYLMTVTKMNNIIYKVIKSARTILHTIIMHLSDVYHHFLENLGDMDVDHKFPF